MKNKVLFIIFSILSLSGFSQELRISTFNLRYDNPRDSGNLWAARAPVVAALIRFHEFDIFGTQEGLKNQLDDLSAALPYYARYGKGRDDGQDKGEFSAIFFHRDKFFQLDQGDFWLSETPDKPGPGWDARLHRICSWVKLRPKNNKKDFYVFNVHFDHQGVEARKQSSKLLLLKIKEIAKGGRVILTGDFNGDHNSEWYKTLAESKIIQDTYRQVDHPYANNGSFNGFGAQISNKMIIDHIFVTNHFHVKRWGILTDTYHGKFPSDHFPVLAIISIR